MRSSTIISLLLALASMPSGIGAQVARPQVVRAATIIDGTGHVLRNTDVVVQNGRILSLRACSRRV
jgi:hypothetical protein